MNGTHDGYRAQYGGYVLLAHFLLISTINAISHINSFWYLKVLGNRQKYVHRMSTSTQTIADTTIKVYIFFLNKTDFEFLWYSFMIFDRLHIKSSRNTELRHTIFFNETNV